MKKKYRIKKNEEFQAIIYLRHSVVNKAYVLYYSKKKEEHGRLGISVSKKMGKANVRNKIKRQVRMMVQDIIKQGLLMMDVILIVRAPYLQQSYIDNKKDLESLIKKVKIK